MAKDTASVPQRKIPPGLFFGLVFAFSVVFWFAGAFTSFQLLPALPLSALAFLCPAMAATICVYRAKKLRGLKDLWGRAFDFTRVQAMVWYLPTMLLMPCIMLLSAMIMLWLGRPLPAPSFSVGTVLSLFFVFFIAALCEELGWSGYACDPLQDRFGALGSALLLGMIWAVWHYIPLIEAHRSLAFIAWWSLGTVAARVIIVWLYNNTGRSVFIATLFHTMINLTWQVFPVNGSFYDPQVTGLITMLVAVVVVVVWRPQTLTRSPKKSVLMESV
ncbi:MAG TPA: CPBP family intramembrane glutamic endopeptidase [Ktedonobacteraceae bacterium]|nr:CPBP family intramembrane glutamic endopeptidase [Ktedonobacteraceae bacterium]